MQMKQSSRRRTPRSSIAPPVHPKHRSLLNEEAEALHRFWNSQRAQPDARVRVEMHLYCRSKSTPNSSPGTPVRLSQPDSKKLQVAQELRQLLRKPRSTALEEFAPPRPSIAAPMRRLGPRIFPLWSEETPGGFGPVSKSQDCGYHGKQYQILTLKDAVAVLTMKSTLRMERIA